MRAVETAAVADELDLGALGRALMRKKLMVIGPTVLVAVLAFVAVNMVTPRYKSEARLLIEGRENVFLRPQADRLTDRERTVDQEAVTSQVQLVLSRDLALQVIRELKLAERPEFDPLLRAGSILRQVLALAGLAKDPLKMAPEERALEAYYDRLTAFGVDKSRVIVIEFSSADPELAAKVANAIAEATVRLQQAAKVEQTRAASQWLGAEIDGLRKRVAEAEAKVEEFRAKSNLFVGPNNTTLTNQQLAELNSQVAIARAQKADAEAKAKLIRDLLKSGQPVESADIINSELIRRLAEQGATLRAQLAEQSSTLLDNHPRIKELKAQIADLDGAIRREAEKLARAFENDARIAGARVDSINASLDQLKHAAAASGENDVTLRGLEREAKAQRDLLEAYLANYREANARDTLLNPPVEARIISRAIVSNTPAFPKKIPIVLIASLATFFLSAAFITTGQLLAGNVYRAADRAADAPVESGVVAPAPRRMADEDDFLWAAEPAPPVAAARREPMTTAVAAAAMRGDSIDQLASAFRRSGEAGRRLTVVGVTRNSGTTSTAIALARALAQEGRAVLIDLALDAPNIAAISNEPGAPGIAELVRGAASFRHIITRDRATRLHVIAAGRIPADTGSVVRSERLAIGINALARTYDHVVIDAGALTDIAPERFARLAPHALLVAPGIAEEARQAARDRLIEAGFNDVTLFVGTPPRPDTSATGPSTEAA